MAFRRGLTKLNVKLVKGSATKIILRLCEYQIAHIDDMPAYQ